MYVAHMHTACCSKLRMLVLSKSEACQFYAVHEGKPFYDKLATSLSSGRIVAMELVAEDAVATWRALIGPTDSERARAEAPQSLRAKFGTDSTENACHGSDAVETAAQVRIHAETHMKDCCQHGFHTVLCNCIVF